MAQPKMKLMFTSTCSICFSEYQLTERIPKLLDCGHTFCTFCLVRLERDDGTIRCPLCNHSTPKRMNQLKNNFALIEVIEKMSNARSKLSINQNIDVTLITANPGIRPKSSRTIKNPVKIIADLNTIKMKQRNHGEWNSNMILYCGAIGNVVHEDISTNRSTVQYRNGTRWVFNSELLVPVDHQQQNNHWIIGDAVKITVELTEFKSNQVGHGGWNDTMEKCVNCTGIVTACLLSGDVIVQFANGDVWRLNIEGLSNGNRSEYRQWSVDDCVRVIMDQSFVMELQKNTGGWNEEMLLYLGSSGVVDSVKPSGAVRVTFANGRRWTFNPILLVDGFRDDKWLIGDLVTIPANEEEAIRMQLGHGGWSPAMKEYLGKTGMVIGIDKDGDLQVHYVSGMKMFLNPKLCSVSTIENYNQWKPNDRVKLADLNSVLLELLQRKVRHQIRMQDCNIAEYITKSGRVLDQRGPIVSVAFDCATVINVYSVLLINE